MPAKFQQIVAGLPSTFGTTTTTQGNNPNNNNADRANRYKSASTNNENNLVYPRSAIKIFQALPFINSNAHINKNVFLG